MDSPKNQAISMAHALLKKTGVASLGVLDGAQSPLVSLVNVATDGQLRPLILISALSLHTKCLTAHPRASLLFCDTLPTEGDALTALRVSVSGVFAKVEASEASAYFLARHPYAELYAGFGDFAYWRMEPEEAHIIAGFGRAYAVRYKDIAGL